MKRDAAIGRLAALLFVPVSSLTSAVYAHHSAAPHFDLSKTVTLEARVTKFALVNPHGYVCFDVSTAGGKSEPWRCELPSRAALERIGWTAKTFVPGQKVTFKGSPARREDRVCYLTSFIRADGVEVDMRKTLMQQLDMPQTAAAPPAAPAHAVAVSGPADLSGYWVVEGGPPRPRPGLDGKMSRPEPSDAGREASKSYDQRFDDPAIQCSPANIIFGWTHDQNVNEIKQSGKEIVLRYGYMDFSRTIHLGLAEHPKHLKPSIGGHSVGHWEGNTLVVDTVGFSPGVLIPLAGIMFSDQMHIVERFTLDAARGTLTRYYLVEDPRYLKAPYSSSDVMLRSNRPYERYRCVELSGKNNQRPKAK